ncbi:unnamed protein product [Gordionus sp. m RMFG-2023]
MSENENIFHLKKWNGVAMWSWDVQTENCAICRSNIMDSCLECQSKNNQDCVCVWGMCNHSFHHCCMSIWIKDHNNCPLCQQEWSIQQIGD